MLRDALTRLRTASSLGRLLGVSPRSSNFRQFVLEMLPKNSRCAEIGVHKGAFSAEILRTVHPEELHLIDPWKHEDSEAYKHAWYGGGARGGQSEMDDRYKTVCARFEPDIGSGRIVIHRGMSSDVLEKFSDEYFDWVYIDGNHLYEFVKRDLDLSFKKTKPGGYITGDDYGASGWWQGGVKKAVDEFITDTPVQVVAIRNYQFVLRKEPSPARRR